jgi:HPt (histidine-containing phosphotransfer) domain-containing protein
MSKLIDFSSLNEMLYGDEAYIREFVEAAMTSFSEFNESYKRYLINRDEANFRKAGHKIKPVAQMLGLDVLNEEYEKGKSLIWEERPEQELNDSIEKVDTICTQVLKELEEVIDKN